MRKHLYISTGERSGELHAANVVASLKTLAPDARLTGMGGALLSDAGVETIADASGIAATGFTELIRHVFTYRRLLADCAKHILATKPDAIVLVDYPGFHFALVRKLRKAGYAGRIVFYICPKVWAWHRGRVKFLSRAIDEVLCIYPFEPAWLATSGVTSFFVGNPLLDELDLSLDGTSLRKEAGVADGETLLGLLPGSRRNEVERLLPVQLAAFEKLRASRPGLRAVVAAAPEQADLVTEILARTGSVSVVPVVIDRSHEVMAAADLLFAKSGTTTLEAALYGTPMIGLYRTGALTAMIGRWLVGLRYFTLPNILACEFQADPPPPIIPELFQEDASPARLAQVAESLLDDDERREEMRERLLALRELLGGPGAGRRTAQAVLYEPTS